MEIRVWPATSAAGNSRAFLRSAISRRRGDAVKTAAARKSSHGTRSENVVSGVLSSRALPMADPARLAADIRIVNFVSTLRTQSRYTHADAKTPGNRIMEHIALAFTGAAPARSRAGKTRNVPPPASAFEAPPKKAAPIRISVVILRERSMSTSTQPTIEARELLHAARILTYRVSRRSQGNRRWRRDPLRSA